MSDTPDRPLSPRARLSLHHDSCRPPVVYDLLPWSGAKASGSQASRRCRDPRTIKKYAATYPGLPDIGIHLGNASHVLRQFRFAILAVLAKNDDEDSIDSETIAEEDRTLNGAPFAVLLGRNGAIQLKEDSEGAIPAIEEGDDGTIQGDSGGDEDDWGGSVRSMVSPCGLGDEDSSAVRAIVSAHTASKPKRPLFVDRAFAFTFADGWIHARAIGERVQDPARRRHSTGLRLSRGVRQPLGQMGAHRPASGQTSETPFGRSPTLVHWL
ncbi:hypothetical protein HDU88_002356 [Geranomyces variabilis]|nr:hypothetical protein HDU88_002356 [Geranomyces variabilis]